jgi:hypothetical protein
MQAMRTSNGTPEPTVQVASDRAIRVLTIDRPDKLNALDPDVLAAFGRALDGAEAALYAVNFSTPHAKDGFARFLHRDRRS